uniref:Uncharacterized protein n=1 Tax=Apteryx owenii TaxID=8824 RepID=A0A8B9PQ36_APTOW
QGERICVRTSGRQDTARLRRCMGSLHENNYRGHGDSVDQLCWHPSNPDLFVTASGDKTIRIWDVRTTKCIATEGACGCCVGAGLWA